MENLNQIVADINNGICPNLSAFDDKTVFNIALTTLEDNYKALKSCDPKNNSSLIENVRNIYTWMASSLPIETNLHVIRLSWRGDFPLICKLNLARIAEFYLVFKDINKEEKILAACQSGETCGDCDPAKGNWNCTGCKDCFRVVNCIHCVNSQSCYHCEDCWDCISCRDSNKCVRCEYCIDCFNCEDCFDCNGISGMKFAIKNVELSEEDYKEYIKNFKAGWN